MKDKRGKYRKKEGFTLVELICVIAIMGILMAIAVPSYSHLQERSAKQVAISNARSNYVQGKAQQEMLDAGVLTEKETEVITMMRIRILLPGKVRSERRLIRRSIPVRQVKAA